MQAKIEALLAEKFKEEEFEDCFIVDINLPKGNRVEIFLDSDSAMTFAKCQKISRYLEAIIDEENWLGEKYTLEVSSPGIDRPLKFLRQYKKNIGRTVAINLNSGEDFSGTLLTAADEKITIEYKERIKEGKKKKTVITQKEIPLADIKKTIVKVSFKK